MIRWVRVAMLAGGAAILYLSGRWVSQDLVRHFGLFPQPQIMTATVVYVMLMAMPFMPAAEIGFGLLVVFGGKIAPLVYGSTLVALAIGYGMVRLVPAPLPAQTWGVRWLALAPYAVRHGFGLLALVLNVPGNSVIGGGGGIALVAGMTGMFPFPAFLAAVALGVAPVPLIVFLAG